MVKPRALRKQTQHSILNINTNRGEKISRLYLACILALGKSRRANKQRVLNMGYAQGPSTSVFKSSWKAEVRR